MSGSLLLAVGLFGGVGAAVRVLVTAAVSRRVLGVFPWGTLAVNVAGTFFLGVLVGAGVGGDVYVVAASGFLGAVTTFSTWMVMTVDLARAGRWLMAGANVALSLFLGIAAIWLGRELGLML